MRFFDAFKGIPLGYIFKLKYKNYIAIIFKQNVYDLLTLVSNLTRHMALQPCVGLGLLKTRYPKQSVP